MKNSIKLFALAVLVSSVFASCKDDSVDNMPMQPTSPDFSGTYMQKDQMGRPAINTVFINADKKDQFNTTTPSMQSAAFQPMIQTNLEAVSPAYGNVGDKNALGWDATTFSTALSTDVLTVSTKGKTTFFDGTNVLTGRALADDVISVELLLIFGGEDGMENPSLTDDNVSKNDKEFLSSFPYLASPW